MKKILVPTDFSASSKAGLRFAIQLASKCKVELIFVHVFRLTRSPGQTDKELEVYRRVRTEALTLRLTNFVAGVYRYMQVAPENFTCQLLEGIDVDAVLIDFCRSNKDIDLVCISTRGAGKFQNVLGTNAGNLISHSATPVMAVPAGYRIRALKTILYATDFRDWDFESEKVREIAGQLALPVEAVHFRSNGNTLPETVRLADEYGWKIRVKDPAPGQSLFQSLRTYLFSNRPSIAILFTNQGRSFLQRLFQPSSAERLAFEIKTPLLVLSKRRPFAGMA